MKIIDLSQSLYDGMKVYPGDPKVHIFVVIGNTAELSVELERKLLQNRILTITDLVNMEKLPTNKSFTFFGVPLKIKDGDGSPIRAFAVLD